MQDCIFCRIVANEIPSSKIYEDAHTLAFLDIGPLVKGHTLVIPKQHYDPLTTVPTETLAACMHTVQRVMLALEQSLGSHGVNMHQANGTAAGQVVPHVHFHVIPRFNDDGHHWNWRASSYASPVEMQELAAIIQSHMAGNP